MHTRRLIVVFGTIAFALAIVLAGCGGQASHTPSGTANPTPKPTPSGTSVTPPTSPPPTQAPELSYNTLSPRGIQPPVQISPLAARLASFNGRTIVINQGEADPVIMPALWQRVQAEFPKNLLKYISTSSFGPSAPEADTLAIAGQGQGIVVRGISW